MDEYGWGLTSAGFRRPTYNELLDALEHKARELFGATANLTVRSPLGLFLRIFAWILNILFSVLEDVYNSRFVDTAVGTSLLNLGRAIVHLCQATYSGHHCACRKCFRSDISNRGRNLYLCNSGSVKCYLVNLFQR